MNADVIEATGTALSKFSVLELVILGFIAIVLLVIVILGKKLVDVWMLKISKDSKEVLVKLNNENQQIEIETNTLVKTMAERLNPLEEVVTNLSRLSKDSIHDIDDIMAELNKNSQERKARQDLFNKEIASIKAELLNINKVLSDHEIVQNILSVDSLENTLLNEHNSNFKRLKAFVRLIALRKNGKIKETGFGLILNDKNAWLVVLDLLPELNLSIVDKGYFDSVMDDINRRIFDGTMR